MGIDFVVFVLTPGDASDGDVVVVDTGVSREAGERRGRVLELTAGEAVRAIGRQPEEVGAVVLSPLHYDHAGNGTDFPNPQLVLQRAERECTAGAAMRHDRVNHFFEVEDVVRVVRRLYDGGVTVIDGDRELRPGLEVRLIA